MLLDLIRAAIFFELAPPLPIAKQLHLFSDDFSADLIPITVVLQIWQLRS